MICYRLAGREFLNRQTSRHCATLWQQISTNMVYMFPMPKLEPKLSFEEKSAAMETAMKKAAGPSGLLIYHPERKFAFAKLLGAAFAAEIVEALLGALQCAESSPANFGLFCVFF